MIGIISDIHGNSLAMNQCIHILKEQGISDIYCLGDVLGYIPLEEEVMQMIKDHNIKCIMGNHEAMVCEKLPMKGKNEIHGLRDVQNRLSLETIKWISSWPIRLEFNSSTLFVHGSPFDNLEGYVYEDELEKFSECGYSKIFMGHTHRSYMHKRNGCTFINVGSVGLPRDKKGSQCLIYEEPNTYKFININYDKDLLIKQAEKKGKLHDLVKGLILNG